MPEALSFCLARAQRPLLHIDRNAHLNCDQSVLSDIPEQQQLSHGLTNLQTGCWPGSTGVTVAGVTPRLELVKDKSTLYLGETCVFYITLSNQGNSEVSAITIKVECSVEGGSNTVLYDNTQSPLPQLPAAGRQDVTAQTDIKEPGVITIVASAVYTDRFGERKYHVQFFKFHSASPLSVKTRVRCLPHIQQPATHDSSSSNSMEAQQLGQSASSSRAYCFLEVSVDNSTPLPLVLHAVNLLTAAGLSAQQLTSHMWQQQQQVVPSVPQQHDIASKQSAGDSGKQAALNSSSSSSDTRLQHDVRDTSSDRDISPAAADAAAAAIATHDSIQLLQQSLYASGSLQQQQQQQSVFVPADLGPLLAGHPPLVVLPPGGGSYNYLWQVQQQPLHRTSSSDGSSWSGSSGAFLGRLELHWSTVDGKNGRLLTQPLSRPITTAAGRDVLMQLTHLLPEAAMPSQQEQQPFLDHLEVGVPVRAVFSLTAAAGLQQQQNAVGSLLVLYSELSPSGPAAAASSGNSGRVSDSSSSVQQQRQGGTTSGTRAEAASSQQGRPGSRGGSSDSNRLHPAVAVQGKRSERVARLSAGEVVTVEFMLLPLRRGWVKLPTFVVVSETDRRLLDSVHDVQVLVL